MNKKNMKESQQKHALLASKRRILLISVILAAFIVSFLVFVFVIRSPPQQRAINNYFEDQKDKGLPASSYTILEMRQLETEEDVRSALEEFLASYGSYAGIDNASLLMTEEAAEKVPPGSYLARIQYNLTPGSSRIEGPAGSTRTIIAPESSKTIEVTALVSKTDSGFEVINDSYQMSNPIDFEVSQESGSIEYTVKVYYNLWPIDEHALGNIYKFKSELSVTGSPKVIYPGSSPQGFIFEMTFYSWEEKKEWWADTWDPYHIIGSGGGWPDGWGTPSSAPWESGVKISVPGATAANSDYFSTGSKVEGNKGKGGGSWGVNFGVSAPGVSLGVSPPPPQGGVTVSGSSNEIHISHFVGFGNLGTIDDWKGIYTDGGTFKFEANISASDYQGSETGLPWVSVPVNVAIYRYGIVLGESYCWQAGTFSPQVTEYKRANSLIQPTVSVTVTPETGMIHQGETCTLTVKITNNSRVAKMEGIGGIAVEVDAASLQDRLSSSKLLGKIDTIDRQDTKEVTFTLKGESPGEIVPIVEITWIWDRKVFTLLSPQSMKVNGPKITIASKPDLTYSDFYAPPPNYPPFKSGDALFYWVYARNVGQGPSGEWEDKLEVFKVEGGADQLVYSEKNKYASLSPDEYFDRRAGTKFAFPGPGTYRLVLTADPDNKIQESDETNNTIEITIIIGDLPDLTYSDFYAPDPSHPPFKSGDTLYYWVYARNVGQGPSGEWEDKLEVFKVEGGTDQLVYSEKGQWMSLSPGEYFDRRARTDYVFPGPGTYRLVLTADPDNKIQESDETNNTIEITIIIGDLPDLTYSDFYAPAPNQPSFKSGDTLYYWVYARNVGQGPSGEWEDKLEVFKVEGGTDQLVYSEKGQWMSLSPDEYFDRRAGTKYVFPGPGTYRLVLTADPDNKIQESDETNNMIEITITLQYHPYLTSPYLHSSANYSRSIFQYSAKLSMFSIPVINPDLEKELLLENMVKEHLAAARGSNLRVSVALPQRNHQS